MELEEAIEILNNYLCETHRKFCSIGAVGIPNKEYFAIETVLNQLEKYKRLAEMNLKDAEEFKNSMCEHRCILYNEKEELKADLYEANNIISDYIDTTTKQEKMIDLMANMFTELKPAHFKKEKGGELVGEYRCLNKKEWIQYFEKKAEES